MFILITAILLFNQQRIWVLNKALISKYVFSTHSLQSVLHICTTQIPIV